MVSLTTFQTNFTGKRTILTIISVLAITLTSCGQNIPKNSSDEGKIEGNVYSSKEVGWTIEIPKGWTITDKEKTDETAKKGLKAIEETLNEKVDYSGVKNLIFFQKNMFNIFQSTSEPFEVEYEGEWEKNNEDLKKIIYSTYQNQGIKVDSSATTIEKIDGLDFYKYDFTIYSPKGEVILKQIMFSKLINGLDFGVNLNSNNDKDRDELLKVFRKSKFVKN